MDNIMTMCTERWRILEELAFQVGISRETLWRYRNRTFPSFRFVCFVAILFRVHIVELLCSKDELREMLSDVLIRRDDIQTATTEVHYDIEYEQVLRTNLRRERRFRCMYPDELVRLAGGHISLMSYYRYEVKCDTYPLWHIFSIASVLGVSPLELLTPKELHRDVVAALAKKYQILIPPRI